MRSCRLYLLSDVLHNSTASVRNASRYRALLQPDLPLVFASLHDTLLAQDSRMTREALKRHVLRVTRVWRDWFLFSEELLAGLQATFLLDPDPAWAALIPEKVKVRSRTCLCDLICGLSFFGFVRPALCVIFGIQLGRAGLALAERTRCQSAHAVVWTKGH